jgi:hypothetical protein
MANQNIGFYFDRFRVLINGQDIAGRPGNVVSIHVSEDGGVTWVDGFSEDHAPSGILRANTHTVFRITENLQYNTLPIDFKSIDYSASSVDIQLIMPTSQYTQDVYNGGSIFLLKSVAWAANDYAASYANNAKRDLDFMVVGGGYWLTV